MGHPFARAAGVWLAAHGGEGERGTGFVVLGALVVLVLVDAVTWDDAGANIGLGGVRLLCLLVLAVVTVRLAVGSRRPC